MPTNLNNNKMSTGHHHLPQPPKTGGPSPTKVIHRNPNVVAKQAAEQNQGSNPLINRLYSSAQPSSTSESNQQQQQQNNNNKQQTETTDVAASSSTTTAATQQQQQQQQQQTQRSNAASTTLLGYRPPAYAQGDLKNMVLRGGPPVGQMPVIHAHDPRAKQIATEEHEEEINERVRATAGENIPPSAASNEVSKFRVAGAAHAPKQFTYMVVRPRGIRDLYNPYDLQVVEHKTLDTNHYVTVSAAGVTRFDNGTSEFIELKNWEREHRIYHRLVQLDVFKNYKTWKSFDVWRKLVRRTKINSHKAHLASNLFLLNKDLSDPLRKVRNVCIELPESMNHSLYKISDETRALDQYVEVQQTTLNSAKRHLAGTIRDIKEKIADACKAAAQTAQDARDHEMRQGMNGGEDGGGSSHNNMMSSSSHATSRRKNVLIDAVAASRESAAAGGHKPSYIEESQKRAVHIRLTSFIRLCDYLVINALASLAMKAVRDVHGDMLYPRIGLEGFPPKSSKNPSAANSAREGSLRRANSSMRQSMRQSPGQSQNPAAQQQQGGAAAGAEQGAAAATAGHKPGTADSHHHHGKPGTASTVLSGDENEKPPFYGVNFFVDVLYFKEEKNVLAKPTRENFTQRIDELIREYITAVTEVPKLASLDVFKAYAPQSSGDGQEDSGGGADVGQMVMSEDEFKTLQTGIKHSLSTAFHCVIQYTATFEIFRDMFHENNRLNKDRVKKLDPPLDWFREKLAEYKQQMENIEKIPNSRDVALFNVKTEQLREFFTPSPAHCLEQLHILLPILAREKNTALLEDLQACNHNLEKQPQSVEEFVEYQEYVTALEARMDSITSAFDNLRELVGLLDLEKIHFDEEDESTYRTGTRPQFDKLRILMQQAEDNRETHIRNWAKNIDQQLETMREKMANIVERAAAPIIEDENANEDEVIEIVTGLQQETDALLKRERELTRYQESFGYDATPINELRDEVNRDINDKVRLWTGLRDWKAMTTEWADVPFQAKLEHTAVNEQIAKFATVAKQVSRTQSKNPVVPKLRSMVDEWRNYYPIIQALKNPKLRDWSEIDEVLGRVVDPSTQLERNLSEIHDWNFGILINHDIVNYREDIIRISLTATEVDKLDVMLQKITYEWQGATAVEFTVNQHKDHKDTYVLSGQSVEDVQAKLDDSLVVVSTIAASKYCIGSTKNLSDKLEADLRFMQDTLDKWLEFQRNWMYLENIFASTEIRNLWRGESILFESVNKTFLELMRRTHDNPSAYRSLTQNNNTLGQQFERDNRTLEGILSQIEKKLEEKRKSFPRFYFLSNDDLLDILSKIKEPEKIAPHMLKMFDGVKQLTFSSTNDITHMNSMEGEKVEVVNKNIKAGRGQVEQWLGQFETEMFLTLRKLAKDTVEDYDNRDRIEWMFMHPVQLVLIVSQIFWSRGVESALTGDDPAALMLEQKDLNYQQLADLADLTGSKLNKTQRSVLSTLITLDVHGRDLVDEMVDNKVEKITDFGWTKQLRSYWDIDPSDGKGNIFICQNNSRFVYGYEYLGAQGRLVITPLTDRIYMTITGALKLYLGASPAGPAGTGKTETVKDLAKNLARQCIVYNCFTGDTPITLADGTSVPIKDLVVPSGKQGLDVLCCVAESAASIGRGNCTRLILQPRKRQVMKLTFADGRTVRCTPEHRFKMADGTWVEAKDIPLRAEGPWTGAETEDPNPSECVMTGVVGTPRFPVSQLSPDDLAWTLKFSEDATSFSPLRMETSADRERTYRFARVLGFLYADGYLRSCRLSVGAIFGTEIDRDAFVDDLQALGTTCHVSTQSDERYGSTYVVELHRGGGLAAALNSVPGVYQGSRAHAETPTWPEFLQHCPIPVLREFLAGLFGGDGESPYLFQQKEHLSYFFSPIRLTHTFSVKYRDAHEDYMMKLCDMLARAGCPGFVSKKAVRTSSNGKCDCPSHFKIIVESQCKAVLASTFMDVIGIRYCSHKLLRCSIAASHSRYLQLINRQHSAVDCDNKIKNVEKVKNGAQCEPSVNVICTTPSKPIIRQEGPESVVTRNNAEIRSEKALDARQFAQQCHCLHLFTDDDRRPEQQQQQQQSKSGFSPAFALQLLHRELLDELEDVYDISVDEHHNFLANGVVAHNCSDGITYKMMEKFFMGLIQTGAWTCLDEFNRINIQVLSVIASQLSEIKLALQSHVSSFTFQNNPNVLVRETYGVFVTMNPGYAGRTELPDNLKILFRPVAVMTPDFRMIAEVILYSEGFKNAKELSLKITQLYKLSSEQLSPQDHYDFGMRALKSILVMAGDLKRSQPDVEEDRTLIVACNDSNVPKFIADDIPLFQGIMADLFPGVTFPERNYPELLPAFTKYMNSKSLKAVDTWVKKGIQFYETLIVRHGVMLVGITNTGKTEARNGIAFAVEEMHANGSDEPMARPVHQFVMNPKSITMYELYGILDVNTNEWRDGVLAVIAKKCVKISDDVNDPTHTDHRWIVFDGPVDTLWIESLNSVLDDSKLLCLDSGERIKLPSTIHLLFEVNDLRVASPATVSRCGMVYLDESHLPWHAQLHQWSETRLRDELGVQQQSVEYIVSLFEHFCELGFEWLKTQPRNCILIDGGDTNLVVSCCDMFAAVFKSEKLKLTDDPKGDVVLEFQDAYWKDRNEIVKILFAFAFAFSFGGNVDADAQESFDSWMRDHMETVPFPSHGYVFDFVPDFAARRFVSWETRMNQFVFDPKKPYFSMIVPTLDTVRYKYIAKTLIAYRKPFLLSGHTGVGKSVIIADALNSYKEDLGLVVVNFQFSAQTSSARTQELIESKLKHKKKNLLGAPPEKHVVFFVDDLNMPALEVFGASPPIELLRQMVGNGGFYDRKIAGFWKDVQDVTMVAACGPPEGGRNPMTRRLTRMFHLMQVANLSEDSMRRIFSQLLQGFFGSHNFNDEVRNTAKSMVTGTVEIFLRIRGELRPKPSTPHYTFNLRDISKVIQGLMQAHPRVIKDSVSAARLWINENLRCFCDRLTNVEDRTFFQEEVLFDVLRRLFSGTSWNYQELFEGSNPIVFGDFLRFGAPTEDRLYEEATDFTKLYRLFDEYLEEYNTEITLSKGNEEEEEATQSTTMDLVFFKDHCEHLARIIRIIRQPRGSALLVGVGGSGKQSLTRLAASVAGYKRFEIAVAKGYSMQDFRNKLLELYNIAGVKNQPIVFLINDSQLIHEGMLEDLNNILNSGEVPSLFIPEERDKKINQCSEAAREQGISGREEIFSFFISRVRDNLHICLCMSPVGDAFRTRCRQFPSLTNCCAIDWFDEWPKEALHAVAAKLMQEVELEPEDDYPTEKKKKAAAETNNTEGSNEETLAEKLTKMCVEVHSSVVTAAGDFWEELRRRVYITPTSYLEFISMYRMLLYTRKEKQEDYLERLKNGIVKMRETNETIAVMKKELEDKQPLLEKAAKENELLVADLSVRNEKANVVKVSVAAQQAEAAEKQRDAAEIEADASSKLAEALPAVEEAVRALDAIDKSDLAVLKALPNPNAVVIKTVSAVMVLFEPYKSEIDTWGGTMDWKGAREFLSFTRLLDKLKTYPKDEIRPAAIVKLQKLINEEPVLTPDICESRGTKACRGMCLWFLAMIQYDSINKYVAPRRIALKEAQTALAETNAKLAQAESALKKVEDELAELQESLDQSTKRRELLEKEVARCRQRLTNAESLSTSLRSEAVRWDENIIIIEEKIKLLPVDMFLSAASVSYFGPFTMNFRKALTNQWLEYARNQGLTTRETFSIIDTLGDPVETLNWQICSLPTDEMSTENAIMVSLSNHPFRWPMMIDPQGQAAKWIINRAKLERPLRVLKQTEPNYLRALDMAIRSGTTVLLDDCGELLDPALEPLLMRQIFKNEGGQEQIQLTPQQVVPYDPNFRLFMCTKLSNPHFLPDITIKATIVNFTVTRDGLEDQMLGEIVGIEQRELEEEKNKIIQAVSEGQKQLKKFEEDILRKLQNASGNILDDDSLINELKNAQSRATFVAKRQVEAKEKIKIINATREMYRNAALRSALLYFVVADLALIDPMYQYSLEFFKGLVANVVRETVRPKGLDLSSPIPELFDKHLTNILARTTETTYLQVCRGLFNRDKMILSLLMCAAILRNHGDIREQEWQYFIRATALFSGEAPAIPEEFDSFINQQRWELVITLTRIVPCFKHLIEDMKIRPEQWMQWVMSHEPHLEKLPGATAADDDDPGSPLPTTPGARGIAPLKRHQNNNNNNNNNEEEEEDESNLPGFINWEHSLTAFQKILLVRAFREEKMMFAAVEFVKIKLGKKFTVEPPVDLGAALADSNAAVPIIFILSQGADPQNTLRSFATDKKKNLNALSLGQGQEEPAKNLIEKARRSGDWALLQNCHLSEKFMPDLELQVANLQASIQAQQQSGAGAGAGGAGGAGASHTHVEFRLWLTSMPAPFFPVFVLQNAIKITTEPPTGLRSNMIRCFQEIKSSEYDGVFTEGEKFDGDSVNTHLTKEVALKKLLYALCFFHSVVLERKKFGPLGWNTRYEWNDTDFHVSKQWLTIFLQEQDVVPWESLLYIIGQINYGGRVTDPQDRITLATVLRIYFNEQVLLDDNYSFSASGEYVLPPMGNIDNVRGFIDNMSTIDNPEAFGMHENANLRHQLQKSESMLATVLSVQPRVASGGAKKKDADAEKSMNKSASKKPSTEDEQQKANLSPEEQVMQKCQDFASTLPSKILREEAHPSTFTTLKNGLPNSLSTVLSHELVKYNTLLSRIEWSLGEMQKALKGLTVLSTDLDAMYQSFLNDQVPRLWSQVSYLSLKPLGAWYKELLQKVIFIRTWVQKGVPNTFWMPGFFNQASFMTGVLQMFARKHGVSVDKLGFGFAMVHTPVEEVKAPPEDGVYVSGIYTDSWRWDEENCVMADALPREMHTVLPIVHFRPEPHHRTPANAHRVPVYRTTARAGVISSLGASSNFVMCIEALTDKSSDYWLLKGAACMCALNY